MTCPLHEIIQLLETLEYRFLILGRDPDACILHIKSDVLCIGGILVTDLYKACGSKFYSIFQYVLERLVKSLLIRI